MLDVPSAQRLFADWQHHRASGFEVGLANALPVESIQRDYAYVENHPIADAYSYVLGRPDLDRRRKVKRSSITWPYDRPAFDLTRSSMPARPHRDYFSLSQPGKIGVLPDGSSRFEPSAGGRHRHLTVSEAADVCAGGHG